MGTASQQKARCYRCITDDIAGSTEQGIIKRYNKRPKPKGISLLLYALFCSIYGTDQQLLYFDTFIKNISVVIVSAFNQ